jgi:hypothetical protein
MHLYVHNLCNYGLEYVHIFRQFVNLFQYFECLDMFER